jgi:hypothetical protein
MMQDWADWGSETAKRRGAAIIFGITVFIPAYLQLRATALGQNPREPKAHSTLLRFDGEVHGDINYEKPIGGGLVFHLMKIGNAGGWEINILPADNAKLYPDYSFLVTLPHHDWQPRYIYPGWEYKAKDVIALTPREFHFLLSRDDYEKLRDLWSKWANGFPADAATSIEGAIAETRTGSGRLDILDGQVHDGEKPEDLGWIESLKFVVQIAVPCDFSVPRETENLFVDRSACPQSRPARHN